MGKASARKKLRAQVGRCVRPGCSGTRMAWGELPGTRTGWEKRVVGARCAWCRKCVLAGGRRAFELRYKPMSERGCYVGSDWDGYRAACAALLAELESGEAEP